MLDIIMQAFKINCNYQDYKTIFSPQIHFKIGNKVDGFFFWCIPNWEEPKLWRLFQLYQADF